MSAHLGIFLSQRGKIKSPVSVTYFTGIFVSFVDNGATFLLPLLESVGQMK